MEKLWKRKYIKVKIGSNKKETINTLKYCEIDPFYIKMLTKKGYGGYENIKDLEYIYIGYLENPNQNEKLKRNGYGYSIDEKEWIDKNFNFCILPLKEERKEKLKKIQNVI